VSLNPALEDAGFCPRCGATATVAFPRSLHCSSCGYAAFFNPTPEATEIRAFAPEEIPWDELAFSTDGAALRDLLGD
jgi:hypothetical protein